MFDVDEFVHECRRALDEPQVVPAIRELVERTVNDASTNRAFTPDRSGFEVLHQAHDLTVLHISFPPQLDVLPHEHRMWAVVGVLDGQEDNSFFRRGDDALVPSGGRELHPGDVLAMGDDTVHAIRNPRSKYLSALHVYGGDLINQERLEWDASGRNPRIGDTTRPTKLTEMARAEEERLGRGLNPDEVDELIARLRAG